MNPLSPPPSDTTKQTVTPSVQPSCFGKNMTFCCVPKQRRNLLENPESSKEESRFGIPPRSRLEDFLFLESSTEAPVVGLVECALRSEPSSNTQRLPNKSRHRQAENDGVRRGLGSAACLRRCLVPSRHGLGGGRWGVYFVLGM